MENRQDKSIYWVGSSRQDVRRFPEEARRKAGFELRAVQRGEKPGDFKPMPDVGKGVEEIRIHTKEAHRIFYVARFEDVVYVLHAFQKKTQKASKKDLDRGRQRYKEMILHREAQKG